MSAGIKDCPACGDTLYDERVEAYRRGLIKLRRETTRPAGRPPAQGAAGLAEAPSWRDVGGNAGAQSTWTHQPVLTSDHGEADTVAEIDEPDDRPAGCRHDSHQEQGAVPETLTDDAIEIVPDPFFGPIERRADRYFVSRQMIEFRHGLIGKRSTSVALWRVGSADADVRVNQTLIQRARNVGDIIFETSDRDTPELRMKNVHNPWAWQALIVAVAREEQIRRNPLNLADSNLLPGNSRTHRGQ